MSRPFRFGVSIPGAFDGDQWRALARRVEDSGFDTLLVPDHLAPRMQSPLQAAMSALDATSTLRVGTLVLNNDLRHPVMVARETATIDLLSGGRFELGIGAGYGREAYAAAGQVYSPAAVRIDRLAESVQLIRRIWKCAPATFAGKHYSLAGQTCAYGPGADGIPILIGGNGKRTLQVAARYADTVGFIGVSQSESTGVLKPSHLSRSGLGEQVALVQQAAGERFEHLELSILVQQVTLTDDRHHAAREVSSWLPSEVEDILDSPYLLLGGLTAICDQLHELRETLGITYVTVLGSSLSTMTDIIAAMT